MYRLEMIPIYLKIFFKKVKLPTFRNTCDKMNFMERTAMIN